MKYLSAVDPERTFIRLAEEAAEDVEVVAVEDHRVFLHVDWHSSPTAQRCPFAAIYSRQSQLLCYFIPSPQPIFQLA